MGDLGLHGNSIEFKLLGNRGEERGKAEWLRQYRHCAAGEKLRVHTRISRHENSENVASNSRYLIAQVASVHAGHNQIGKNTVNLYRGIVAQLNRLLRTRADEHAITRVR